MIDEEASEYTFRCSRSTWGIYVHIVASSTGKLGECSGDHVQITEMMDLCIEPRLHEGTVSYMIKGLQRLATQILLKHGKPIRVTVHSFDLSWTDFQDCGAEPAIVEWAAEHFMIDPPEYVVHFDPKGGEYGHGQYGFEFLDDIPGE